jgi:GT2 family glycosyltransferase
VILVDNASADGTYDAVKETFPSIEIFKTDTNLGCAGGRNFGAFTAIEKHCPDYLLIVDNDTVVEPDFIDHLVNASESDQNSGIVTAKIMNYASRDVIDAFGNQVNLYTGKTPKIGCGEKDIGQYDSLHYLEAACGCCQLIHVELWKKLGGYDDAFSPYAYEDIDMSLRVRDLGKKIILAQKAKIYHKSTQTIGDGSYVSSYTQIKGKNMRRFLAKHSKFHHKVIFLIVAPFLAVGSILRAIRSGDPKAAFRMFSSFFFSKS